MPRFGEDSPIEGEHDLVSAGFSTCLHALCWQSGLQALWSWGSMELFAWTSKEEVRGFVLPYFVGALILVNTVRQCGIQLGCMYCMYLSCTSPWSTSCVFSEVNDSFVNT